MPSTARARLLVAVAALAFAASPLSSSAQSTTGETGPLEPPILLDASEPGAVGGAAAPPISASTRAALAKAAADAAAERKEAESLSVPADTDAGKNTDAGDSEKPGSKRRYGLIDQYPQNPRCYVAGRYVPAPPMCPH